MVGDTCAAQAIDNANAAKLRATIRTAIAADHATPAPAISHPAANAASTAKGTNGRTRRTSSRSGSTVVTISLSVPQVDGVHAPCPSQHDPDRQEHVIGPCERVD